MQNGLLKSNDTDEIHDSQYTKDETNIMSTYWKEGDKKIYHYIDLLAIVQNIKSNSND